MLVERMEIYRSCMTRRRYVKDKVNVIWRIYEKGQYIAQQFYVAIILWVLMFRRDIVVYEGGSLDQKHIHIVVSIQMHSCHWKYYCECLKARVFNWMIKVWNSTIFPNNVCNIIVNVGFFITSLKFSNSTILLIRYVANRF